MKKNIIGPFTFPIIFTLGLVFLFFIFSPMDQKNNFGDSSSQNPNEKQKGAHVFGIDDTTSFQYLNDNNIEWVTMVSWASQDDYDSWALRHHNGDSVSLRAI